jgi:uncharacterized protein YebE (UPF0316 family)
MISTDVIIGALVIFMLRIFNSTLGTLRVVAVTRQMRLLSSFLAFIEALTFAVTLGNIVTDLDNFWNLMAYCGGFSAGNFIGISIENRFITSYRSVNVITNRNGREIAQALRHKGYGVTETLGEGRDGTVTMLRSVVTHRDVPKLLTILHDVAPDAFVAVEEARAVEHGWIQAARNQK